MKTKLTLNKSLLLLTLSILLANLLNAQYTISTIAGNGTPWCTGDGGPATAAELDSPEDVSVDVFGNIYIADGSDNRVRLINTSGIITTFAGSGYPGFSGDGGPATSAKMYEPKSVSALYSNFYHCACLFQTSVFISDFFNSRIRIVDPKGVITTLAGNGIASFTGDGGPATAASINAPSGIATDMNGNVYFADEVEFRVRMINTAGIINTVAGDGYSGYSGDGGPATAANIGQPIAMATDFSGNYYIADITSMRVRQVNSSGIINTVAGGGGSTASGIPATNARLNVPMGIATDSHGNIYIANEGGHTIQMVTTQGIIYTIAGTGAAGFSGDGGPATAAELNNPDGVAIDATGNVYVSEYSNNRVRKLTLTPLAVTITTPPAKGFCGTSIASATAVPSGGFAPYTYSWSPGSQTSQTIGDLEATTYTVTVTDIRGAQATNTVSIICRSPIGPAFATEPNHNQAETNPTIYPNPTNGQFNIQGTTQGSIVEIYNALGLMVKQIKVEDATVAMPVDINEMPNGIYFIKINDSNGSILSEQKLIKAK